MRVRTRGGIIASGSAGISEVKDQTCAQVNWTTNYTFPAQKVGSLEVMSDEVTPRFKSRQAKGSIFMNPMSKRKTSCILYGGTGGPDYQAIAGPYGCSTTLQWSKQRQSGNIFGSFVHFALGLTDNGSFISPSHLVTPSEVSRLIADVNTSCWADRQLADSNLFESVAEYRQTMRMFGDLFLRTRKYFEQFFRQHPVWPVASTYLMIRYGIMPLVRDVQGIVKGLEKPRNKRVRKTTRKQGNLFRSSTSTLTFSNGNYRVNINRETNDEVLVRAMSIDEYNATLAANIGFTDNGLIVTPWELIPWSFVLDWFVNVGKYLQALVPMQGRQQLGSCYVVRRMTSDLYTAAGTSPVSGGTWTWQIDRPLNGSMLCTIETVDRYPSLAPPSLILKPNFRLDEYTRAADALALVTQIVRKIATK